MPDPLILVVLAVLGALVILGLGMFTLRYVADLSLVCPPISTAYRVPGQDWRAATLRFHQDRLALKGPGGLIAGPWLRGNLDLGIASAVVGQDAAAIGRDGLIQVPVTYGTATFDLAMGEEHYTALRAWVEAVPPGWNASIA